MQAALAPAKSDPRRQALIARLWREYVSRYWRMLAALTPVTALVAGAAAGYVAIIRYAGQLLERGDDKVIYQIPVWIVAIAAVRAAAMYAQAVMTSDIAHRVLRDLQNAMFASLSRADYSRISGDRTGAFVSRFTNDITVIAESLVRSAGSLLRDVLTLLGTIAMMIWIDWVLAVMVIALFGLAGPPLGRIASRARKDTKTAQLHMGDLTAFLTESLSSARLVRTYGLEAYENDRAAKGFETRRKMQMRFVRNRSRSDPLLEILGAIALAAVLAMAGFRISHGEASIADMLAFIGAIATGSAAARGLGSYNTVVNEGLAAVERVFALLDEEPKIRNRPNAPGLIVTEGRVQLENVSFRYENSGAPTLEGVNLMVQPGETVALVGPSGAGKTTVFNLIPRLFDPDEGRVLIDGVDVRSVTVSSLRRAIAVVSQDVTLFNDTVAANIGFGFPNAARKDIEAAAEAAAAYEFIAGLPQGFDSVVGERGALLSGGQRQRIALARAFLRNAPILLLDEATSALDAESEAAVQEALTRLARGRTTLVVAHRLATVRSATRIIAMEGGRIIEEGRHEDLIARGGLYARLFKLQFADA